MTLDARHLEASRLSDESKKERQQRVKEYVKQMGFTSVEAYKEDQSVKEREGLEACGRKLDERCALLGKTREQLQAELEAEDPQRWIPGTWLPECDCEDHPIPSFCPHSLVDYNSMDSQNVQEQKRERIEDIRIQPGDESNRLSHRALEYYWKTEDMPADMPLWAKEDKVLEHMIPPSYSTKLDIQLLSPKSSVNENAVANMDVGIM